MNLPKPTDGEVAEFAAIYERKYGVRLSDADAREAATTVLQLFCLGTYGMHFAKREADNNSHGPPS